MTIPVPPDPHRRMQEIMGRLSPMAFDPSSGQTPLDRSEERTVKRRPVVPRKSFAEAYGAGREKTLRDITGD